MNEEQTALLPDEEDIRFYRQNGYYLSRKILPDDLLDAALTGSELLYAGKIESRPSFEISECWNPEHGENVLRKNDFTYFQRHEFADIINFPLIGAIAAKLAGEPVRLWHDQLLYKPADTGDTSANIGWHTDRQYWRCCTSTNMLTAWVPFRDVGVEEGSISFIDSSQRWSESTGGLNFREQDLDGLEKQIASEHRPLKRTVAKLKRGQVSFHHCMTIHGSGPNMSSQPRQSLAIHMQPAGNRWCKYEYRMADGSIKHHDVERLVRKTDGVPDFSDPALCPQLWPKEK